MRRKAGILLSLVMLIMCLPSLMKAGDTIVSNGLCYEVLDGDSTVCLIAPVNEYEAESAVIPSMVEGYHVTEIASGAFAQCQWLTEVSLPATLTAIGEGAFAGCEGLATIFSHVPNASLVLPHLPDGALLAVDGSYRDLS